ncbi:MAG: proton-conducting transporter membrane subunit [Spirochaetes bacterium]|nr:proton-conducting transporter membrane subunit [Spirochaetota bacterium]
MKDQIYYLLTLSPFCAGLILFFVRSDAFRAVFQRVAAALILVIAIASAFFLYRYAPWCFPLPEWVEWLMLTFEIGLLGYAGYRAFIYKKYWIIPLILVQAALTAYGELVVKPVAGFAFSFHSDELSLVMVLVIGVTGAAIASYAHSYMRNFHGRHPEIEDRRPFFSFLLFTFIGAMFGLVTSNSLFVLNFFWELTTICSCFLIGYPRNDAAVKSAFRALGMNLAGGIVMTAAIVWVASTYRIAGLNSLLSFENGALPGLKIAVACLVFAALIKSAQFPFSSWLLGAMVAPTPVSALLHSSTMVKAGVYLIIRLLPAFKGSVMADAVALIGILTFALASAIAMSIRNAKRLLAYSTIANLGLIVACAGGGTPETLAAAILLIIFHAVAKSSLFLCVGSVEHIIDSRDIEAMDSLVSRVPTIAYAMIVGIGGMFLPPLGMLVSKWMVLGAFVDAHNLVSPFLILLLAFGSAFNLFFWGKWLGKIISPLPDVKKVPLRVPLFEQASIWILAFTVVATTFGFPLIVSWLISPYVSSAQLSILIQNDYWILAFMILMLIILPGGLLLRSGKAAWITPYLAGRNAANPNRFTATLGAETKVELKNYYFGSMISEPKWLMWGNLGSILLLILMYFGAAL